MLPVTSAGALFHAGIAKGKFHGVIRATTPSGCRRVKVNVCLDSEGSVLPWILLGAFLLGAYDGSTWTELASPDSGLTPILLTELQAP